MEQFLQEARALLPWLPESLIQIYANSFAETQNKDIAIAEVRASEDYETYFPKNKRDDGTVRLSESDYASVKESYGLTIEDYGMNKDYFENTFATLIEKGGSPNEFRQRVETASAGILQNIPAVKDYYSTNFGMNLNDNQILASIIDPDIGQSIIEGKITAAQIGGEGQARGFDLSAEEVQALERAGLTQAQARQLFSAAETEVPRLANLQRRFERRTREITLPDDFPISGGETIIVDIPLDENFGGRLGIEPWFGYEGGYDQWVADGSPANWRNKTDEGLISRPGYSIEEYIQETVFGSAEQKRRRKKLLSEQASASSPIGGAARRGGRVTGLTQG